MTSVQGVWGELGDGLLAAGLELSCSHGNTATGVEKMSDWSDEWRWGVFLFWCWGNEAELTSENWSRCRRENRKGRKEKGRCEQDVKRQRTQQHLQG